MTESNSNDPQKSAASSSEAQLGSQQELVVRFLNRIGVKDQHLLLKIRESIFDSRVDSREYEEAWRQLADAYGGLGNDITMAIDGDISFPDEDVTEEATNQPPTLACQETLAHRPRSFGANSYSLGQFGDYEILEEIARGGMGIVCKARQIKLNRIVALKRIRSADLANAKSVQRFYTEAESAAKLSHPNIVPVFDIGETDGQHYFSMAFVDGPSLSEVVSRDGPLAPGQAARLMVDAASAVEHAHQADILHRDIKPQNLLLDQKGQVQMTDFGLAKLQAADSELTANGQVLGTPAYMPPEQAAGRMDEVGVPADVYSLGATLYFLLTGRPPFQSSTIHDTLRQVLESEPVAPRKLDPSIPRDLETICLKAIRKDKNQRYPVAADFAKDLQRWLNGEPIQARRVSFVERAGLWSKRHPSIVTTVAVLIATALIVLWTLRVNQLKNQENRLQTAIASLEVAPGPAIPYAIDDLDEFPQDRVTQILRLKYRNSDASEKLPLAFALARYGDVRADDMIQAVTLPETDSSDGLNIATSLAAAREESLPLLHQAAEAVGEQEDWQNKTRLAIVGLHLGDVTLATEMLSPTADEHGLLDPTQRTSFISYFPSWPGNFDSLAKVLGDAENPDLRSGICLALGQLNLETPSDRTAWQRLLLEWYCTQPDSGTHNAARWAITQWNVLLPDLASTNQPNEGHSWWEVESGHSLVWIPSGSVLAKKSSGLFGTVFSNRKIELEDPAWVSCQEVTVRQYMEFVDDSTYGGLKPDEWPGPVDLFENLRQIATPKTKWEWQNDHPVQNVSFYDAVLYCNWLSAKEELSPCYQVTADSRNAGSYTVIQLPDADGYRLPTQSEWEFACRSMTTTSFCSGNDLEELVDYANFEGNSNRHTSPSGEHMCNAWGLFDMHGNVEEWCCDQASNRGIKAVTRGGHWFMNTGLESFAAGSSNTYDRYPFVGFRIARNSPMTND